MKITKKNQIYDQLWMNIYEILWRSDHNLYHIMPFIFRMTVTKKFGSNEGRLLIDYLKTVEIEDQSNGS